MSVWVCPNRLGPVEYKRDTRPERRRAPRVARFREPMEQRGKYSDIGRRGMDPNFWIQVVLAILMFGFLGLFVGYQQAYEGEKKVVAHPFKTCCAKTDADAWMRHWDTSKPNNGYESLTKCCEASPKGKTSSRRLEEEFQPMGRFLSSTATEDTVPTPSPQPKPSPDPDHPEKKDDDDHPWLGCTGDQKPIQTPATGVCPA